MELLQLYYFMQAAKQENITKTANQLHIAQPALSQTIKRLEKELGLPLFDRRGKHIYLNDYGKIVAHYTQQIFSSITSMKDEINDLSQKDEYSVSLSMLVASSLLPKLLKEFRTKEPHIQLTIHQSINHDYQESDHDLTIYATNQKQQNDILLLKEQLVILLPKQHPLANRSQISLADLKDDAFISLEKNSSLHQMLVEYCHQSGYDPNIQLYSDNPNTFREILDLGIGVTLIPSITWQNISFDHLITKPISNLDCFRYIYLHLQENKYERKNVTILKNQIIQFFSELDTTNTNSQA